MIAFFFLLRPCEITGKTADDAPFHLQDVALFIGVRRLNVDLWQNQRILIV
jgi:hypothetical protein